MERHSRSLAVERATGSDIIYEIGAFVATSAQVDYDLGEQIVRMLSTGGEEFSLAEPLVIGMDFKVKLTIIRLLARNLADDDIVRVQRLCDKLQDLYQRRNDVAHLFVLERKGQSAHFHSMKINIRTGHRAPARTYTAKQIRQWAENMEWWSNILDLMLAQYELPVLWPSPFAEPDRELKKARRLLDRIDPPNP